MEHCMHENSVPFPFLFFVSLGIFFGAGLIKKFYLMYFFCLNKKTRQVETIIFNLVNNIDIIETNRQIEQYKKENKEQISKSRHRKPTELLELEQLLLEEARLNELRHLESLKSEKAEKLRKLKSQDALIDDLMFSDGDAKSIVEQHKAVVSSAQQDQQNGETKGFLSQLQHGITTAASTAPGSSTSHNTFTSGISFGSRNTSTFLPVPKVEEVPLFVYRALELEFCGPSPPSKEHLLQSATTTSSSMYLSHIRPASEAEIAGGYHHLLACRRALQDAFMDIAMQPELLVAHKIEGMDTS